MYKLSNCPLPDGTIVQNNVVIREDGACIPFDPANTDYQAFLAWKAEGNEPLPADEPESQA
jgi:hypothetical protein